MLLSFYAISVASLILCLIHNCNIALLGTPHWRGRRGGTRVVRHGATRHGPDPRPEGGRALLESGRETRAGPRTPEGNFRSSSGSARGMSYFSASLLLSRLLPCTAGHLCALTVYVTRASLGSRAHVALWRGMPQAPPPHDATSKRDTDPPTGRETRPRIDVSHRPRPQGAKAIPHPTPLVDTSCESAEIVLAKASQAMMSAAALNHNCYHTAFGLGSLGVKRRRTRGTGTSAARSDAASR